PALPGPDRDLHRSVGAPRSSGRRRLPLRFVGSVARRQPGKRRAHSSQGQSSTREITVRAGMRILINLLNFRPGKIGGTEPYLRELVAHLPGVIRDERIMLLTSCDVAGEFADPCLEIATVPWTTSQLCAWRVLEAAAPWLQARSIAAAT